MRVTILWESKNKCGGGWSFTQAFKSALGNSFVENWHDADICLIPSASVISKELFREVKAHGKKIVLRVDNSLKHSRNKGAGMSRLKEFGVNSDLVVFQGRWCMDYLGDYIGNHNTTVIHNGIDLGIFNSNDRVKNEYPVFLYSNFSGGENKGWHEVWYLYQEIHKQNQFAKLVIVGKPDQELINWNFDFFRGEDWKYLGVIDSRQEMARIYRTCDYLFAPYQYDAFSQTYMEALCCGCELYEPHWSGGTPELLELWETRGAVYFSQERMIADYINVFNKLI